MGQLGFFDADWRLAGFSEKGDPLEAIASLVPWESPTVKVFSTTTSVKGALNN